LFAQAGLPQAKYAAFLKKDWKQTPDSCLQQVEEFSGHTQKPVRRLFQALHGFGICWFRRLIRGSPAPEEKLKSAYSEMTNRNAPPSVKSRRKPTFTITKRNIFHHNFPVILKSQFEGFFKLFTVSAFADSDAWSEEAFVRSSGASAGEVRRFLKKGLETDAGQLLTAGYDASTPLPT
jgi:hypothetical protein